jgi:hypothetical protein
MKKCLHIILFLFGLAVMAACHDNQSKTEERTNNKTQRLTPIEKVASPDISHADDTLSYKGYVFFSQPVPEVVKTRMLGKSLPEAAKIGFDELRYLTLYHYDFKGHIQQGEMVCNKAIAHDLLCIFRTLFAEAYPINSIRLVDDFEASDETSMQANNSSCFNYRTISGSWRLSQHAFGMAVDINPLQNPCVKGSRIRPATATDYVDRSKHFPHKIDDNDFCKKTFESYGFRWGGRWRSVKDYQHFEKKR